jgi:hypothetical protein
MFAMFVSDIFVKLINTRRNPLVTVLYQTYTTSRIRLELNCIIIWYILVPRAPRPSAEHGRSCESCCIYNIIPRPIIIATANLVTNENISISISYQSFYPTMLESIRNKWKWSKRESQQEWTKGRRVKEGDSGRTERWSNKVQQEQRSQGKLKIPGNIKQYFWTPRVTINLKMYKNSISKFPYTKLSYIIIEFICPKSWF